MLAENAPENVLTWPNGRGFQSYNSRGQISHQYVLGLLVLKETGFVLFFSLRFLDLGFLFSSSGEGGFCIFPFCKTNMTYMDGHSVVNRGACGWLIKNTLEG